MDGLRVYVLEEFRVEPFGLVEVLQEVLAAAAGSGLHHKAADDVYISIFYGVHVLQLGTPENLISDSGQITRILGVEVVASEPADIAITTDMSKRLSSSNFLMLDWILPQFGATSLPNSRTMP